MFGRFLRFGEAALQWLCAYSPPRPPAFLGVGARVPTERGLHASRPSSATLSPFSLLGLPHLESVTSQPTQEGVEVQRPGRV